jgi:hypothetical protein
MRCILPIVLACSLPAGADPLPVPEEFRDPGPPPETSTFETDTVFGDCGYYRVDAVRSTPDPLDRFDALELHYVDDSLSPGVDWHLVDTYGVWARSPTTGSVEPLGYDARFEDTDGDGRPECVVTLRRVETAGNGEVVLGFGLDGFTVVRGLDEDLIRLPLKLDGGDYAIEALWRRYGWYVDFEEVGLYRLGGDTPEGRVLVGVYPGPAGSDLAGESLELEDFTGDGRPEVVAYTNTGGNDPLVCCGLAVLEPTPEGFRELFYGPYLAPVAVDADSDGVTEIFTYSAYASGFVIGRAYRASFIDRVYTYDGERYVPGELSDYGGFIQEGVADEMVRYEDLLIEGGSESPLRVLSQGQVILAQLASAHLDDEYARWWEGHRGELRGAVQAIEGGDWGEVERDFATPEAFRTLSTGG